MGSNPTVTARKTPVYQGFFHVCAAKVAQFAHILFEIQTGIRLECGASVMRAGERAVPQARVIPRTTWLLPGRTQCTSTRGDGG